MTFTEISYFLLKFAAVCVILIGLASVFCGQVTWLGVIVIAALVFVSCVSITDGKAEVHSEGVNVEIKL